MATTRPQITSKVARRFGAVLDGSRHFSQKRLQTPPGFHGPVKAARRRKESDYSQQLNEKQKARYIFGISEKRFRKYVQDAIASKEISNIALYSGLEKRLDNAVYRLGFAPTRAAARQMVSHGLVTVNGKRLNVPSYEVRKDDVIGLRQRLQKSVMHNHIVGRLPQITPPSWLVRDDSALTGKVMTNPAETDFDRSFDATAIIEFYSR